MEGGRETRVDEMRNGERKENQRKLTHQIIIATRKSELRADRRRGYLPTQ